MFIHVGMLRVPTSVLISYLHQQLVYIIMCCELCQQLFSTFFDSFLLFRRRHRKLIVLCCFLFVVVVRDSFVNIHPTEDKSQQLFLKYSQIGNITKTHNFILHFCASYTFQIMLGGFYIPFLHALFLYFCFFLSFHGRIKNNFF